MTDLAYDLSLYRDRFAAGATGSPGYDTAVTLIYVVEGSVQADGATLAAGAGARIQYPASAQLSGDVTELVRWEITPAGGAAKLATNADDSRLLLSKPITLPGASFGLRMDTVTFPPSTRAYRHIHAAAGIRYLLKGSLEINSTHGIDLMLAGRPWFEGIDDPVLAIADSEVESQFARVLVLPEEYLGKLTITYIDPADDDKPREQINKRLVDEAAAV
jgi:hypothetical protein